jgi:fatty-acyl-CoA synthase
MNQNQPITYREWNQRANRLANFLRDGLRVQKGDRVGIYSMKGVEYLDALFACNKIGETSVKWGFGEEKR